MPFDALRSKLRTLTGDNSADARDAEKVREATRRVGETARRRAPATGLEGNRKPRAPTQREELAQRLQSSGEMRKPIEDANLKPGEDPRKIEKFATGEAGVEAGMGSDPRGDPYQSYFSTGDDPSGGTAGPLTMELLDEQDHEGGLYAYEDEREESAGGGVNMDVGVDAQW